MRTDWMASLAFTTAAASLALAGPLSPPVGPPESTDKPLIEVEPRTVINEANTPGDADSRYRITQPGSYYLIRNEPIIGVRHGIEIAADDVTIDLMGFTLFSQNPLPIGSPPVSLDGITTDGDLENITIRNGAVHGFGEDGVDLSADTTRFEDLALIDNQGEGLRTGADSVIARCEAVGNGGSGFIAQSNTLIVHSTATGNGVHGFGMNGGYAHVLDSTAKFNATKGIQLGYSAQQSQRTALGNAIGFRLGSASMITDCNASLNSDWGIEPTETFIDQGSFIERCLVVNRGIIVNGYTLIRDCVVGNTGSNDGIRVNGRNNRVEGNHVHQAGTAFNVNTAGNLIIRNSAVDSTTTYSISGGNRYGEIVVLSGTTPAVSGGPAPSVLGTTDPWANFAD